MRPVALACCAACVLGGGVFAQSLGDLAARESARRAAVQAPARVLTNADLKPVSAPPTPSDDAPSVAPADVGTQASPRVLLTPAVLEGGAMPALPVSAINGGEVILEVEVDAGGGVSRVTPLRDTPPFTQALADAVATWRFTPAEDAALSAPGGSADPRTRRPVESKVLVLGLFRPPSVFQGMAPGTPPVDRAAPAADVAAPLGGFTMPPYPVQALFDDVVLLEIPVHADGTRDAATVVRGAPPFDTAALEAVASLRFRPPRVQGRPAPAQVYVAVGFRQPITP